MKFSIKYPNGGKSYKISLKAHSNGQNSGVITNLATKNDTNSTNLLQFFLAPKLKKINLISAINQISVMTSAGISIKDAIKEVEKSIKDVRLKQILSSIEDLLNQGRSFTDAASDFKSELGNVSIAMIRLGESTGRISEALFRLANILQEIYENKQKFKKAIRYPVMIIATIMIAFAILMSYVVPKFNDIFNQLETQLPLPTTILINVDNLFTKYWLSLSIFVLILSSFLTITYNKSEKFKFKIDSFVLKIYLFKDVIFYSTMTKFNLIFAELISSGIPIITALETSIMTVSNKSVEQKLSCVKLAVERGISLTKALENTGLYENMLLTMIKAGEQSGNLELMLNKITLYYKAKFNDIVDNISTYIEPILIGFVSILVAFLALGVFMPMWDLAQATRI